MPKYSKKEREEALASLRESISEGKTIWTMLMHRSASGMSRVIQIIVFSIHGEEVSPLYLGYNAAKALDLPYDKKHEGIKMGGCGYNAGLEIVSRLSRALFGESDKLKERAL